MDQKLAFRAICRQAKSQLIRIYTLPDLLAVINIVFCRAAHLLYNCIILLVSQRLDPIKLICWSLIDIVVSFSAISSGIDWELHLLFRLKLVLEQFRLLHLWLDRGRVMVWILNSVSFILHYSKHFSVLSLFLLLLFAAHKALVVCGSSRLFIRDHCLRVVNLSGTLRLFSSFLVAHFIYRFVLRKYYFNYNSNFD